jgi:hypothetical protein
MKGTDLELKSQAVIEAVWLVRFFTAEMLLIQDTLSRPLQEQLQIDFRKMALEEVDELLATQTVGTLKTLRTLPQMELEDGSDESPTSLIFKVFYELRTFVKVAFKGIPAAAVRCAFSDRNSHSRMPLDPTHVCLKRTRV